MKSNHLTDATKILILVATVIIVCILCAIGFKIVNNGKAAVSANTNTLNDMSGRYQEIDLSLYDNSLVPGSEVANIVKNTVENKKYLCISLVTLAGSTTNFNYDYDDKNNELSSSTEGILSTVSRDRRAIGYINPTVMYLGETYKDKNDSIICIKFTQQP